MIIIINNIYMPQLVPFHFLNLLTYGFLTIIILLVIFSKVLLPRIVELYVIRLMISKI
mgnify:CR=1 FL=1